MVASFRSISLINLALISQASAHFVVNTPPPLGDNINNEDIAPCGGFTPSSSDNATDFHVGGDAIGLTTLHAQCYLAYRGMLGTSLSSPNWTILLPTIEEFGLNNFCEPSVAVPSSWAGSSGLLQIIQDAEDGVHYQCMAVNFIAGTGTPSSSSCSNSSGVSANFADDNTLSAAESAAPSSSSSTPNATSSTLATTSSTSSAQASASPSKSAALPVKRLGGLANGIFAGLLAASVAGLI